MSLACGRVELADTRILATIVVANGIHARPTKGVINRAQSLLQWVVVSNRKKEECHGRVYANR